MWRRVTLGVLVALAAAWVLTCTGGSPPATAARPLAASPQPRPGAVSQDCHIHSRVTVDRSPAIMILLRICNRPVTASAP